VLQWNTIPLQQLQIAFLWRKKVMTNYYDCVYYHLYMQNYVTAIELMELMEWWHQISCNSPGTSLSSFLKSLQTISRSAGRVNYDSALKYMEL